MWGLVLSPERIVSIEYSAEVLITLSDFATCHHAVLFKHFFCLFSGSILVFKIGLLKKVMKFRGNNFISENPLMSMQLLVSKELLVLIAHV